MATDRPTVADGRELYNATHTRPKPKPKPATPTTSTDRPDEEPTSTSTDLAAGRALYRRQQQQPTRRGLTTGDGP